MENIALIQFFEWYIDNDGEHWNRLKAEAAHLAELGIASVWIPPSCKASEQDSVGYDVYDLFDLGEFDQKGTVRTKYGTKQQLKEAIDALHEHDIKVYADVVLNHKAGADETEVFAVVEVARDDRLNELSEPFDIEGWTKFTFPGRGDQYSSFTWNFSHFSATDRDEKEERNGLFKIVGDGKIWSKNVDSENNNYDYLMFADIDYNNEHVINEIKHWVKWFVDTLDLDGFRLDAVKHIDQNFIYDLISYIREHTSEDFFVVGEYWHHDKKKLNQFVDDSDQSLQLVDVALHSHFYHASNEGKDYNLSTILDKTLVKTNPFRAVTFVDNHDTQPGQSLEAWVKDWFKPLAYALILLRKDGLPCVFYGDYYGIGGDEPIEPKREMLDKLLHTRKHLSYGKQEDYFDHANVIGWVRLGDDEHENSGIAVVMSNGDEGTKDMCFGPERSGWKFHDVMGHRQEHITLNDEGWGTFTTNAGSVSVWVRVTE